MRLTVNVKSVESLPLMVKQLIAVIIRPLSVMHVVIHLVMEVVDDGIILRGM